MRIQLLHLDDWLDKTQTDVLPSAGDLGTIIGERHFDWVSLVDVRWDNGSTLSLIWGQDAWKVLELDEVSKNHLTT